MARWAEDDDFNGWVAALRGGESEVPDVAIDPADMHIEMPEIPVAGSADEGGLDRPADVQADDTEREQADASDDEREC